MTAEAWGLRVATAIALTFSPDLSRLGVLGDNLPIVRYGAGTGRLRRQELDGLLAQPVAQLLAVGVDIDWVPFRRRFNTAADEVATSAVLAVAATSEAGGAPVLRVINHAGIRPLREAPWMPELSEPRGAPLTALIALASPATPGG